MDRSRKRIVLIGPVYPYKGGISHYTGLMCRALEKRHEVIPISFKLQYPGWLFRKEQKDYTNDSFKISSALYWIHAANPINWLLCARKIRALKPDLVILQWWHPYFAPCYRFMTSYSGGARILYVCHNVLPHERFLGDRALVKWALRKGNGYIVQSRTDEADLKKLYPRALLERAVHPTYNAFRFSGMGKAEARERLGLSNEEKVLLFFGFIREYKGLKHLIRAIPLISVSLDNVNLLIVGDFGGDKEAYMKLIQENEVQEAVTIRDGYIPDQEVEPYFAACDLVVLPYESATQSGIVQLAYGFEKPVIVTAVGGLPDVVKNGKTGYVVPPFSPEDLAGAVIRYFKEDKEKEFQENVEREAWRFSWDRMTETVERLYEKTEGEKKK